MKLCCLVTKNRQKSGKYRLLGLESLLTPIMPSYRTCELRFIDCTEDVVYVQVTELEKGETIDMDEETGINTSEERSWAYQDG